MIGTCLKMAEKDGALTIAFPTVGCGKLNYPPDDVVDCFVQACQETRSNIKVRHLQAATCWTGLSIDRSSV